MIRSKYRNRSTVEKPWSAETISPLVKFYFFVRVDKRVVSIYTYIGDYIRGELIAIRYRLIFCRERRFDNARQTGRGFSGRICPAH